MLSSINFGYQFNPRSSSYKKNDGDSEVAFLTTNDSHGRVGKLPELKTARDEFKSSYKNSDAMGLVLTSGDNFIGFDESKHNIWVKFLNTYLKPDAILLGNHEFDNGSDHIAKLIQKIKSPVLAANVNLEANKLMNKLKSSNKISDSIIIDRKGVKVGVIGVTTPETHVYKTDSEMNGVKIQDFEQTRSSIKAEIEKLKSKGINKIVLLSHLGYPSDFVLAGGLEKAPESVKNLETLNKIDIFKGIESLEGIKGIDVIIGGHTHDLIHGVKEADNLKSTGINNLFEQDKINLITPKHGEPVLITQAGANNDYVGYIDLVFDKNGVIKKESILNKNINIDQFEPNKAVAKQFEKKLGKPKHLFTLSSPFIDPQRISENAVQDLVADAILDKANKSLPEDRKADVALVHGALARGDLKGEVSTWDIEQDIIPFEEKIGLVKLSEDDLVKAFNNSAKITFYDKQKPVLLHPSSNLQYTINKKPESEDNLFFVESVVLNGKKIDVKNPSKEKNINVLVDNYFLSGDPDKGGKEGFSTIALKGMEQFLLGKNKDKPENLLDFSEWTNKEALIEYLEENYNGKVIELNPDDRIGIVG